MTAESRFATQVSVGVAWVVRFSGLRTLYTNFTLPTNYDNGSGGHEYDSEDYLWSPSLLVDPNFGAISQKMQPKFGIGKGGDRTFKFQLESQFRDQPDAWLSQLNNNRYRSDDYYSAVLLSDLASDDTGAGITIEINDNPWGSAEIPYYFGVETILAGSVSNTATTIEEISLRGAYGSQPLNHFASAVQEMEISSDGYVVADYPMVWRGRFYELFMVTGVWAIYSGVARFTPYGDSLDHADVAAWESGVVKGFVEGGDMTEVSIECSSLLRLLEGPIVQRHPTFKCGLAPADITPDRMPGAVYISAHNHWMHFSAFGGTVGGGRIAILRNSDLDDGVTELTLLVTTFTAVIGASGLNEFTIESTAAGTILNLQDALTIAYPAINFIVMSAGDNSESAALMFFFTDLGVEPAFIPMAVSDDSMGVFKLDAGGRDEVLVSDARLRRETAFGNGVYEDVDEGFYTLDELGYFMSCTVAEVISFPALMVDFRLYSNFDPVKGESRVVIDMNPDPYGMWEGLEMYLATEIGRRESFLRDLGFDGGELKGKEPGGDSLFSWRWTAKRAPALFRWPAAGQGTPESIPIYGGTDWDRDNLELACTVLDKDGTNVAKQICIIEGVDVINGGTVTNAYANDRRSMVVSERSIAGAYTDKELYIPLTDPSKQKEQEGYRTLFFDGVRWLDALRYMLLGGSGAVAQNHAIYDAQVWPGCGYNIPSRFVDSDQMDDVMTYRPLPRSNLVLRKGDKGTDLIREESKVTQLHLAAKEQIYIVEMDAPSEAQLSSAYVLDDDNVVLSPEGGYLIGFDRGAQNIINRAKVEAAFNNATGKYELKIKSRQIDSISIWGEYTELSAKLRSVEGTSDAAVEVKEFAGNIFVAYAFPYAIMEVYCANPDVVFLRLGREIVFTSDQVPDTNNAKRGVANLPAKLMAIEAWPQGKQANKLSTFAKVTMISQAFGGRKYTDWAPCVELYATTDAGTTWQARDHSFSESGAPVDLTFFEDDDISIDVYVYEVGDDGFANVTIEGGSVSISGTTDLSEVEFDANIGSLTPPLIMGLPSYAVGDSLTFQQKWAYLCGATNLLANTSTNDAPFYYM